MKKLLIGYTGFVGSNLKKQIEYSYFANSQNIHEFAGMEFDEITIAAGDARKWIANQDKEKDFGHIQKLFTDIKMISAKRVIFFSTVDVFNKKEGDEDSLIGNVAIEPYGKNRYKLENMMKEFFEDIYIIRIPGLFGKGLKKNIIYDVLNEKDISGFNLESKFQWFYLDDLKYVIDFVITHKIREFNVSSEPLSVKNLLELLDYSEGLEICRGVTQVDYDFRTKFAPFLLGKTYFYEKKEIEEKLLHYVKGI